MPPKTAQFEVIIVGGGPAGLSAALLLGRARRSIIVLDSGHYRNERARNMHGYLTRDGILPRDFLRVARQELSRYRIKCHDIEAVMAKKEDGIFHVTLANGDVVTSRMLLIATGVRDRIPKINGIEALYGTSVHHCPYCDGWEWSDKPVAILGRGKSGLALAMKLRNWSTDLVLCTHGPARYSFEEQHELERHGVTLEMTRIARLEGENGYLREIVLRDGRTLSREALFFTSGQDQSCGLPAQLGCEMTKKGVAKTNTKQATNIAGLYVAGDAARDMHFVIVAAAEGAKAAVAINEAFTREEAAPVVEL